MPVTKQVIKRMKQAKKSYERNRHYKSRMKSMIKLIFEHIEKGEADQAKAVLSDVMSAIDVAAKKKIIHKNNAAHKKSRVQKMISNMETTKAKPETKVKAKEEKVEEKVVNETKEDDKK